MSGPVITLEPRLDLQAVTPLVDVLRTRRGSDLALDAGDVTHIGALAVQALRSAARSWAADGHSLTLENATPELTEQLSLLGFTPETLTQWEVRP